MHSYKVNIKSIVQLQEIPQVPTYMPSTFPIHARPAPEYFNEDQYNGNERFQLNLNYIKMHYSKMCIVQTDA